MYASDAGLIFLDVIVIQIRENGWEVKTTLSDLYMGNVINLTKELESSVWIPLAWPFLLKHFIPQVLLILFINLAFAKNDSGTEFPIAMAT